MASELDPRVRVTVKASLGAAAVILAAWVGEAWQPVSEVIKAIAGLF